MEFPAWISTALGILTIATVAGLGFTRSRVVDLREQLSDSREEVKSLKASRTEDQAKMKVLEADLAALSKIVTGEAHWVAIGETLDTHHDAASAHWRAEHALLEDIRDELKDRRP